MTASMMRAYTDLLVATCHRRRAFAIGGMAAFIPSRRDPEINERALAKVREDKEREAGDGFDGSWVAHPDLVPICEEVFDKQLGDRPNQLDVRRDDVSVSAEQLLDVSSVPGDRTAAGLRNNIDVGLRYLAAWLGGNGAVGIHNLMEDAATAEISRAQVWQWVHNGVRLDTGELVTAELVRRVSDEVLAEIRAEIGDQRTRRAVREARTVFEQVALADDFPEFLTLSAAAWWTDKARSTGHGAVDAPTGRPRSASSETRISDQRNDRRVAVADLRFEVNLSILFTELPLLERPQAAKQAGFDAVEFWWPWSVAVPSDVEVERFATVVPGCRRAAGRAELLRRRHGRAATGAWCPGRRAAASSATTSTSPSAWGSSWAAGRSTPCTATGRTTAHREEQDDARGGEPRTGRRGRAADRRHGAGRAGQRRAALPAAHRGRRAARHRPGLGRGPRGQPAAAVRRLPPRGERRRRRRRYRRAPRAGSVTCRSPTLPVATSRAPATSTSTTTSSGIAATGYDGWVGLEYKPSGSQRGLLRLAAARAAIGHSLTRPARFAA